VKVEAACKRKGKSKRRGTETFEDNTLLCSPDKNPAACTQIFAFQFPYPAPNPTHRNIKRIGLFRSPVLLLDRNRFKRIRKNNRLRSFSHKPSADCDLSAAARLDFQILLKYRKLPPQPHSLTSSGSASLHFTSLAQSLTTSRPLR
jgi:hypothetical protein